MRTMHKKIILILLLPSFLLLLFMMVYTVGQVLQVSTATEAMLVIIEDELIPLAGDVGSVKKPVASGSVTYSGGGVTIDASNAAEGYIMAKYSGTASKVKIRVTKSGGTTYTYDLNTNGTYEVFPLSAGNGTYTVEGYTLVSGNQYATSLSQSISVELKSSTLPFLYPNQQVNFNENSNAVAKASSLASSAGDELTVVTNVYNYVTSNITYDTAKANQVTSGAITSYLPDVDKILSSGKGICFDYASVMAAMLRSQNIPTRLEVGYVSGSVYHAWISVYSSNVGWINDIIYFDGKSWQLMDPTLAASNGSSNPEVGKFIGNGSNYSTRYYY